MGNDSQDPASLSGDYSRVTNQKKQELSLHSKLRLWKIKYHAARVKHLVDFHKPERFATVDDKRDVSLVAGTDDG